MKNLPAVFIHRKLRLWILPEPATGLHAVFATEHTADANTACSPAQLQVLCCGAVLRVLPKKTEEVTEAVWSSLPSFREKLALFLPTPLRPLKW